MRFYKSAHCWVSIANSRKPLLQQQCEMSYIKWMATVSIANSRKPLLQHQQNAWKSTIQFQSLIRENPFCNDDTPDDTRFHVAFQSLIRENPFCNEVQIWAILNHLLVSIAHSRKPLLQQSGLHLPDYKYVVSIAHSRKPLLQLKSEYHFMDDPHCFNRSFAKTPSAT